MDEYTMQVMARERFADILRDAERGRLLRGATPRPTIERPGRARRRFGFVHRLAHAAGIA